MREIVSYIILYMLVFGYGICIGSFSNVCILRLPAKESIMPGSHCMSCGYKLRWYDLFPLFSYIFLGGKCRKCKAHISLQYPLVEGANGVLYVLIFIFNGFNLTSVAFSLASTALIALSVVDFRTFEIPDSFNVFILVMGIAVTILDGSNWKSHIIGMFSVSVFLLIIYLVTAGRAMGGGDIKLMAVGGLLLGIKCIIVAFFFGCILGSIIHIIRMKVSNAERRLAMGPYLAGGMIASIFIGEYVANWYLTMCGLSRFV